MMRLRWILPVVVILVNAFPSDFASDRKHRLCRYDKSRQQCVDIPLQRQKCTCPVRNFDHSYVDSRKSDKVHSKKNKGLASGRCAAKEGSCEFREKDDTLRCRCWNATNDEEVTSSGKRLCKRRVGICMDIKIRHKHSRGWQRRKQARGQGRRRKIRQRRRRGKNKRSRGRPYKPLGRCAAQHGTCENIEDTHRQTKRKCECKPTFIIIR